MSKRLLIDLEACDECERCGVSCAYFYRPHLEDHGVLAIRERATFALVCRRCAVASCIEACPYDALERDADGLLSRHNLRCVSCKLCAHACPFGTIYPDTLSFYVTPCDHCLSGGDQIPPCVASCDRGALAYRELNPDEIDVHVLDDRLAARAPRWIKHEGAR